MVEQSLPDTCCSLCSYSRMLLSWW